MLIAGYLREDFIKKSLELPKKQLESLLICFKDTDYLLILKEPNLKISEIFDSLPNNILQDNITLWRNTLKEIIKKGRYFKILETKLLIASKPKEQINKNNFIDEELIFYIKSLTGKIWLYSIIETDQEDDLYDMKCFSSSFCIKR